MVEKAQQNQKEGSNNSTQTPSRRGRNQEKIPFSNPEIEHKFTLKTQEAIRLYTRHFNMTSQALFNIMINTTRLERLGQKGIASSAKKAIDAALDIPTKEIELGLHAFTEMLNSAGDVSDVKYTNPREFTTSTRTPEATKLIRLFKSYDLIITVLDKAYLNALAPADEVEDTKAFHTNNIQNLSKIIKSHAQSSIEQLENIAGSENKANEQIADEPVGNEEITEA